MKIPGKTKGRKNGQNDGQKDGETLLYTTLPTTAGGPIKYIKYAVFICEYLCQFYICSLTKPDNG